MPEITLSGAPATFITSAGVCRTVVETALTCEYTSLVSTDSSEHGRVTAFTVSDPTGWVDDNIGDVIRIEASTEDGYWFWVGPSGQIVVRDLVDGGNAPMAGRGDHPALVAVLDFPDWWGPEGTVVRTRGDVHLVAAGGGGFVCGCSSCGWEWWPFVGADEPVESFCPDCLEWYWTLRS